MSQSPHFIIMEEIVNLLQGGTIEGILNDRIKIQRKPKVGEKLDKVPCVLISPYGEVQDTPLSFEDNEKIYLVEIVVVNLFNNNFADGIDPELEWINAIARKMRWVENDNVNDPWIFRTTLPNTTVYDIDTVDETVFDRDKLNNLYSYQRLVYQFHTVQGGA